LSKTRYVPNSALALIHMGLGDSDRAFELLERAVEEREINVLWLKFDSAYDAFRANPRFDALLKRVGFPADPPAPVVEPWPEIKTRLAVLPFEDRSGDPDARYLADEIPASIIDSLSTLSQLQVVPRSTAFRQREQSDDLAAVGRLLNAYAVLTGQINARGDELRIRAELEEVATGRRLWSERYDQSLADTMAVETEITERIAEALQVQFGVPERARLSQRCPANPEAHCKYLEGRFWWNKRAEPAVRKSIQLFEKALSIDPQYALAYAGLADSYCVLGWAYDRPSDMFPKAHMAAERALAIDPNLAEAYPAIGFARLAYDWDPAGSKEAFDKGLTLNPRYANAHHWYTMYLMWTGRPDEALASARRAQKLDPGSVMISWSVGTALYVTRNYAAAADQLQRTLEMEPDFPPAMQMLGMVYLRMERYEAAIETYHRLHELGGYGVAGRRAEALEELRVLEDIAKERYIPPTAFALVHAGLGDMDEAFQWMDRAVEQRDCYIVLLRTSPSFDELRADPRFDDLLRRIGTNQ
jgi:TolB-like protein/Tfp pilus assembly protein PilF